MTDYPKALAALREARTKFDAEVARVAGPQTMRHHAEELSARVLDFLDALDAARGEAVAWYRPSEEGYDSAFRDASTVDRCTGHDWAGWVPLYAAPPAALAVPDWRVVAADERGWLLAVYERIIGNAHPEEDSRVEIAYAIARHLGLDCPCAHERNTQAQQPAAAVPDGGSAIVPADALREVIRISDRSHPAWDAVKAAMLAANKENNNG